MAQRNDVLQTNGRFSFACSSCWQYKNEQYLAVALPRRNAIAGLLLDGVKEFASVGDFGLSGRSAECQMMCQMNAIVIGTGNFPL